MAPDGAVQVDFAFDFGPEKNRDHLFAIRTILEDAIVELSTHLESGTASSTDMDDFGLALGDLTTYVADLCEQAETMAADVRTPISPPTPSIPGDPWTGMGDPESVCTEFMWLIQEILSISEGTFCASVTKDTTGFRVMLDWIPAVVRYDTDVPMEIPEYARTNPLDEKTDSYMDRAKWSQERASERIPDLVNNLSMEFPEVLDEGAVNPVYRDNGVTFRLARLGPTVSVAVDPEGVAVAPVRSLKMPAI